MKDEGEGSSQATDPACTLIRKKDVPGQTGGILAWPARQLVAVTHASVPTGQPNPLTHSVRIRKNGEQHTETPYKLCSFSVSLKLFQIFFLIAKSFMVQYADLLKVSQGDCRKAPHRPSSWNKCGIKWK